jgi:hypothetical protein
MESFFFILVSSGIGYILHKQDRMDEKIDNITGEIIWLRSHLPKRKTDDEL